MLVVSASILLGAALWRTIAEIRREAHTTRVGLAQGLREANWFARKLGIERATDLRIFGALFTTLAGMPWVSDVAPGKRFLAALVTLAALWWYHRWAAHRNERLLRRRV